MRKIETEREIAAMPSIFKEVLMKGYNFSQLKGCREGERLDFTPTGRTFACMMEKKKYTNLLFATHLHSNVTSLISTKRKTWNNV